jgi:hypothetical protein
MSRRIARIACLLLPVAYTVSADVRFTEGEATTGRAETVIDWTPGAVCQGHIAANGLLTEKASPGTWIHGSDTFTARPGATSALVQVGIDKIEPGGTLSALVDNVAFGLAPASAEELVGYIAVAGSSPGITFSGEGLILYGATADNTTNDPSVQFMPYLFAVA